MKILRSHRALSVMFLAAVVLVLAGCTSSGAPKLITIGVTPGNPSISVGATKQFTATGTYSDNSTKDITTTVTWTSGTPATATITAGGLATALAGGTTTIQATSGTVTGSTLLTVTVPTLVSIAVTPANLSIALGATQQFTATGTYSDNSTKDITTTVTWTSGTPATATITAGGLAMALAGGTSTITAKSGTISGTTTLTVVTLVSIKVTPANPSIALGATQQFTATGTYSDNSMKDITATVTWSSGTTATATISAGGLATSVKAGTSTITATSGAISGNTLLTVLPPTLVSIKISPANPTIPVSGTADFTGVGLYSDGSTQPLAPITWSTTSPATSVGVNSTTGVTLGLVAGSYPIKATGGGVTGTTQLTVVAGASRFAYTANGGDGTISIYAVNGSTFTPRGYAFDGHSAVQAVPDPSGKYVFALNVLDLTISTYYVDPVGGGLTDASTLTPPIGPVTVTGLVPASPTPAPYQGIVDPTGQFLYVAYAGNNAVVAFTINTANGSLTQIGAPVAVGNSPTMVLTDRTGSFLYVINSAAGTISGFSIAPATGALTALTTVPAFPVNTGSTPFFCAIDPSNTYLYVGDSGDNTVAGYTINTTTGALNAIAGSPFSLAGMSGPEAVVIDPTSKYLYSLNFTAETISGYSIGAGGVLSVLASFPTPISTSPTGAISGSGPFSMSIDPAGAFITVSNQVSDTVAIFAVNAATGALTSAGSLESRLGPQFTNIYFASAAPTLAPAAVYATNSTAGTISAYTVSSGALTPTAAPETGVAGNSAATTDVTGQFFYATSTSGNDLLGFNVTEATAALAPLTNSPYTLTAPSSIVADPSDRYVVAAETGAAGHVQSYSLDKTTNSLNVTAGPVAVANLNAIVDDPQGQTIYALGLNLVESVLLNTTNGVVTAGTTVTPAGNWGSGAVDASGQYLLALDLTGKTVQAFSIGPLSVTPLATAGVAVPTGLTTPTTLVIDPLNRFVFVSDTTAKTISAYAFNPLTGVMGATVLGATAALGGTPGQLTIDATGTYLYVAVQGTPATNAGSVAAFKITSTGPTNISLTAVGSSPFAAGVGTSGVAVSNSIK